MERFIADGQEDMSVAYNSKIDISKVEKPLKLVHLKDNDFFEACREKLGWSLDITSSK